ncbi:hypothetical protein SDC9_201886 [bioreactor metagenome]|uniref:Uncharacterized protein n=1 Tax=bioreactor metagenome TaxID=1076179 RepID=A0A645ISW5_9ZZZZ
MLQDGRHGRPPAQTADPGYARLPPGAMAQLACRPFAAGQCSARPGRRQFAARHHGAQTPERDTWHLGQRGHPPFPRRRPELSDRVGKRYCAGRCNNAAQRLPHHQGRREQPGSDGHGRRCPRDGIAGRSRHAERGKRTAAAPAHRIRRHRTGPDGRTG